MVGQGNGAISAFADAMHHVSGLEVQVVQFDEQALGAGTNAEAMAFIQANVGGKRYTAVAQDNDTLSAGLEAILGAVNKALTAQ